MARTKSWQKKKKKKISAKKTLQKKKKKIGGKKKSLRKKKSRQKKGGKKNRGGGKKNNEANWMVSNSAKLDRRTKQHTQFGVSASNGSRDMARTKSWRKKKKNKITKRIGW